MPINFPEPPERAIASYDWVDVASGTGLVKFNLAQETDTGGTGYFLTNSNSLYSDNSSFSADTGGAWSSDYNFDITFVKPLTIEGDCYIQIAYGAGGGGDNKSISCKWEIVHYDGSTETNLATGEAPAASCTGASCNIADGVWLCLAPVAKTTFKVGETLRLTLNIKSSEDGTCTCDIYTDPADRSGLHDITGNSALYVPVVVDI